MLRGTAVWSCTLVLVAAVGAAAVQAADTPQELKQLDTLEGYKQLPKEGTVKQDLTTVPKQAIESIIVWSDAKPSSGAAPLKVDFTADPPPGVSDASYSWQFGDGSAAATGQAVSHTFAKPGIYKVLLKVGNAAGTLGEDELRVKVTQ